MARSAPVLLAQGLRKEYGSGAARTVALDGVDLEVHRGRMLAIVGPSGSGKSTLLHLLAGLDDPSTGTISIAGTDLATMSDAEAAEWRARHAGFVLQRDNLIPALRIAENVAAPLLLSGVPHREAFERARAMLARVGLERHLKAFPGEVSGGQAQRAALARACVGRPTVVFADEPTGALDRATGSGVIVLLREMVREVSTAAIVVTHDAEVAAAADEVIRLEDGRIAETTTSALAQS
jgi:ABC-type lipoprotein export system ATPase subunit